MIIDTSAVCAVLFDQAEAIAVHRVLLGGGGARIGSPTHAEAAIVLQARIKSTGMAALRSFLVEYDVSTLAFGDEHWRLAAQAFEVYGRGRHPAALNFGDCLVYATTKLSGEPLLCAGGDFAQTDLELVPLNA